MDFEINQPIHYLDQNGKLQPAKIYSGPILSRNNGNRKTPKVSYQVLNKRNHVRKIPLQWILDGQAEHKKRKNGISFEELNEFTRQHILPKSNALLNLLLDDAIKISNMPVIKVEKENL